MPYSNRRKINAFHPRLGYGAVDCTVDLQTPPTVFPMEDALCDARNDICSEAFLSGSPFLNIGSLLCSFTPLQVLWFNFTKAVN